MRIINPRRYAVVCWCELGAQVAALIVVAAVVALSVRWSPVGFLAVPATLVGYVAVLLTTVPAVWLLATERGWRLMGRVARKRCWRVRWREAVSVASQEKLAPGRVVVAWRTRYGAALVVAMPRGRWLGDYRALEPRLTTALGAQAGVRIRQHHQQPRLAQVRVRRRDPLADVSPVERLADRTSWRQPLDIGVDEDGRSVRLDLIRAVHVLVGGTPGSGNRRSRTSSLPIWLSTRE